jgi:hypothetical protein
MKIDADDDHSKSQSPSDEDAVPFHPIVHLSSRFVF